MLRDNMIEDYPGDLDQQNLYMLMEMKSLF